MSDVWRFIRSSTSVTTLAAFLILVAGSAEAGTEGQKDRLGDTPLVLEWRDGQMEKGGQGEGLPVKSPIMRIGTEQRCSIWQDIAALGASLGCIASTQCTLKAVDTCPSPPR